MPQENKVLRRTKTDRSKSRENPANNSPRKLNIYDIARAAGVSPGTVSRVMNNRDRVKDSTREAVLKTAKQLGFQPQAAIRKPEIALITEPGFTDRINGYSATLVQHLSFELTRRDYNIELPEGDIDTLRTAYFNGMIVISHGPNTRETVAQLESRIPTIHIDLFDAAASNHVVYSDHEQAGYLAGMHFAQSGRKRPGFLAENWPPNTVRLQGFRRALEECRLPADPALSYLIDEQEAPYIGLNHLVRANCDAIYVPGASLQAMEALHILTYVMKKEVPEEIALIGGENDRISCFLNPPLTTIEEPLRALAQRAVHHLGTLLNDETTSAGLIRETLPVRLIRRVSGG